MLYILLGIIAFGVLLLSDVGRALLLILAAIGIGGALLIVGFYLLMGANVLISENPGLIEKVIAYTGSAILIFLIYHWSKDNFGTEEKTQESLNKIKSFIPDFWKKDKTMFLILSCTFLIFLFFFIPWLTSFNDGVSFFIFAIMAVTIPPFNLFFTWLRKIFSQAKQRKS